MVWVCLILMTHKGLGRDFSESTNADNYPKGESDLLYEGIKYWNRTKPKSPPFLDKVLVIANKLESIGKTDAAIYWYQYALRYTHIGGRHHRISVFNRLGNLFRSKGEMGIAISMYQQAYLCATDSLMRAQILVNQSNVYQSLKNYKKALEVLDVSLPVFTTNGKHLWIAINMGSQALIYRHLENYGKAICLNLNALHAIALFRSLQQDSVGRSREKEEAVNIKGGILTNLASIYLNLNLADSAYFYLGQAVGDWRALTHYTRCGIQVSYGEYYQRRGNLDTAIIIILNALPAIDEGAYQDIKLTATRTLSELYERNKNFKQALYFRNEYISLKDSLTSFENIHRINALETQYQLSQKDKILAEKELKITQQTNKLQRRNWIVFTSIVLSLAVFIILVVSRKSYRNKQKLFKTELKHSRQQQKLARMEAMIDGETKERTRIAKELHDSVVNEVLALKLNLTDLVKDFSVLRYAPKFKSILHQSEEVAMRLRETAHNLLPAKIRENGLFNTIGAFIEKINAPVHFTFQHYGTLPPLEADAERIILLSVLELIQNILKHARASEALVQLNYFEDVLSITVEDDGVGLPPEGEYGDDKGIGLQGVMENVELLGATIDIQSGEYMGTTVLIEIPLSAFTLQREGFRDAV